MVCSNLTFVWFVWKGRNEHRHEREHGEVAHMFFRRLPTVNMASPNGQACKNSTRHHRDREHAEDFFHRLPTVTMAPPTRQACKTSTSHRHDGKHGEDRADDCERDRQRGVLAAMTVTFT